MLNFSEYRALTLIAALILIAAILDNPNVQGQVSA